MVTSRRKVKVMKINNKDLKENEVIKNNVKRNLPNNVAPQEVAAYSDILIKLGGRNDLSDKDVLQALISDIESESHTQHEDMQHEEDKIATQVLSELEKIKNSLMEMINLIIEEFNSNAGFTPILGQPEPGVLTKELLRDEPCHEDPLLAEGPVNWGLNEYMEAYEIKMSTLTEAKEQYGDDADTGSKQSSENDETSTVPDIEAATEEGEVDAAEVSTDEDTRECFSISHYRLAIRPQHTRIHGYEIS